MAGSCLSGDSVASCIESSKVDSSVSSRVTFGSPPAGSLLCCFGGDATFWASSGLPCLAISVVSSESDSEDEQDEEEDDEDEEEDDADDRALPLY